MIPKRQRKRKSFSAGSLYRVTPRAGSTILVQSDEVGDEACIPVNGGELVMCIGHSQHVPHLPLVLFDGFIGWVFRDELAPVGASE